LRKGRSLDPEDIMPKLLAADAAGPGTKAEKKRELRALRKRLNVK